MTPPALAQALIAAAAPASDYESIAGDLHEEYRRVMNLRGTKAAHRWYWAQTLLSIPSLLAYSRSSRTARGRVYVAVISIAVLFAMLCVMAAIETLVGSLFGIDRTPHYVWLLINYAAAIVFGAILARLVRTDGLRVAFCAAVFLVLCFVIPALAGNPHSQAPPAAWMHLLGVIPAMCFGAAFYHAVSYRIGSAN